jgi:hypothetical protein
MFRFGSNARFGPGSWRWRTSSVLKRGVEGSAATCVCGGMCETTQPSATTRVSVRVSGFVSRIDHVSGTTSNSSVTGVSARKRPASAPSGGTIGST